MIDAYDIARKYIRISKLMDKCSLTMFDLRRMIKVNDAELSLFKFHNKTDALYYNGHPVIDHKIAWGDECYGHNFVSFKPLQQENYHLWAIIFDPDTNIFYDNIDDRDTNGQYYMKFDNIDEHLFQMEILLNDRFDAYAILHALHVLGYDKKAFIHLHSSDVLDKIIDNLEIHIENHEYNEFDVHEMNRIHKAVFNDDKQ